MITRLSRFLLLPQCNYLYLPHQQGLVRQKWVWHLHETNLNQLLGYIMKQKVTIYIKSTLPLTVSILSTKNRNKWAVTSRLYCGSCLIYYLKTNPPLFATARYFKCCAHIKSNHYEWLYILIKCVEFNKCHSFIPVLTAGSLSEHTPSLAVCSIRK